MLIVVKSCSCKSPAALRPPGTRLSYGSQAPGTWIRTTSFNTPSRPPKTVNLSIFSVTFLWWHETERPCGTRLRNPKRGTSAPRGLTNPLSLHDRCFDLVTRPRQSSVPNPPSRSPHRLLVAQNDETPVGSAFRGLMERLFRGLPSGQPRNSRELRLTHQDFQGAWGCPTGIHDIPCADAQ